MNFIPGNILTKTSPNSESKFTVKYNTDFESKASFIVNIKSLKEVSSISTIRGIGDLKKPLPVEIFSHDDIIEIKCTELNIYECGSNFTDALMEFEIFFREDFENLKNFSDEEMSSSSRSLKNKYYKYVP